MLCFVDRKLAGCVMRVGSRGGKKSVLPQLTGVGLPESLETRAAPHQSGQEGSEQLFDLVPT